MHLARLLSPAARHRWRILASLSAVAAIVAPNVACETAVTDPTAVITRAALTPDTLRLAPGATGNATVYAYDKDNRNIALTGHTVTWRTANPSVATARQNAGGDATVSAVAVGTTELIGTVDSVTVRSVVVVATPTVKVARVRISAVSTVRMLDSGSVGAGAYDSRDSLMSDTRAITWSSSDPSVLDVQSLGGYAGVMLPKRPGTTTVRVTIDGLSDSATVTVVPPDPRSIRPTPDTIRVPLGGEAQATFVPLDRRGGALPDSAILVELRDADVVRLSTGSPVTGRSVFRVTGARVGSTELTVTSGYRAKVVVPVIVTPAAPPAAKTITISPRSLKLRTGTTATFGATVTTTTGAAWGGTVAFRAVGSGASITSGGVLSASQAGNVLVIASADAVADTAQVTVFGIDSVRIAPHAPLSLVAGASTTLNATVYGGGQALAGEPIAWSTTNGTVVDVAAGTGSAVIGAKAAGTASVIASAGGKADTVAVTVTAAAGGNTLDIHPLGVFTIKRLADGTTATFNNLMVAGDHEENGDKSLQAFASYLFTALPAGANVTAATLTVRLDPAVTGAPFTLGALVVEPSTGSALNEGALSTSAIPLATSITPSTVTVNVLPLVRAALAAGQPSLTVRFRFTQLTNGNGKIDYLDFFADPLTLTYTTGGSLRASKATR